MRIAAAGLVAVLMLAGCAEQQQQQSAQGEARQGVNADRYNRDREICRGTVNEYMRTRRNTDDSSREVRRTRLSNVRR